MMDEILKMSLDYAITSMCHVGKNGPESVLEDGVDSGNLGAPVWRDLFRLKLPLLYYVMSVKFNF